MKKHAWFRLYTSVLDPLDKSRTLSDRLHRQWIYLQAAYRRSEGVMPELPVLATVLGVSRAECTKVLDALYKAELLDDVDGQWVPTDWDSLQYENDRSTERVRAFRERKKKQVEIVSGNGRETVSGNGSETGKRAGETDVKRFPPSGFSECRVQSAEFGSDDEKAPRVVSPSSPPGNGNEKSPNGTRPWWAEHWAQIADWLIAVRNAAGNLQAGNSPPRVPDRAICMEIGACFETWGEFAEWAREKAVAKQGGQARSWAWFLQLAQAEGTRKVPEHAATTGGE